MQLNWPFRSMLRDFMWIHQDFFCACWLELLDCSCLFNWFIISVVIMSVSFARGWQKRHVAVGRRALWGFHSHTQDCSNRAPVKSFFSLPQRVQLRFAFLLGPASDIFGIKMSYLLLSLSLGRLSPTVLLETLTPFHHQGSPSSRMIII